MAKKEIQTRKSRFDRVPDQRILQIQPRDIEILVALARYRFLTSRQLIALTGGGEQGVLRRLHRLFHNGFINRPRVQIKTRTIGTEPMAYALSRKGADWLCEQGKITGRKQNQIRRDQWVRDVFLDHALLVSNFMVTMELACQAVSNLELLRQEDMVRHIERLNLKTKMRDRINPLCGRFLSDYVLDRDGQKIKLSIVPDQLFGLYFPDEPDGKNEIFFALEADRSTMPIIRSDFKSSSYLKKMLGYWEGYHQNVYEKLYGIKGLQVLTITTTKERINNMIEAGKLIDQRKKGSRMFLFACSSDIDIERPTYILEQIWRNGRDKELVSMIE